MGISQRRVGEVTIIDLSGRFMSTEEPNRIKDKITSLVFGGHTRIVLNLADVSYIDSSGLGELVAGHLTARRVGGVVKLANASARMRQILELTKLVTIFEMHASEAEAIDSFTGVAV